MKPHATLVLKPGREKSLLRLHPWVFSGAIGQLKGQAEGGATVAVRAADGRFLAWAAHSPASQIRARAWSFSEDAYPDEAWLRARVAHAVAARAKHRDTDALRLVHAEADGLPGLVADRYADLLVVQIGSAGAERWREALVDALRETSACARIYERSDADVRALEGLAPRCAPLLGGEPRQPVVINENGLRYAVDVVAGQKTGFFLDQRDNRVRVGALCRDREVLNCFCYTGGFTLSALAGGARSVLSVDSSAAALQAARNNVSLNDLDASRAQWLEADVFRQLRQLRAEGRSFDVIVLDPPKFAPTSKDAERAARGYKDINLQALRLLRPGGRLATFSCSSGVNADLFQKIVAGAAADAAVSCRLEQRFTASPDHPVLLEFPEGDYLKGLLLARD
jgi:23S rRNA (cytosine1962-C5)-methyltransferase